MSLRIKVPKLGHTTANEQPQQAMQRKSSKRRISSASGDEDTGANYAQEDDGVDPPPRAKRPRVSEDMDVDMGFEEALDVDVVSEEAEPGPSETPQYRRASRNIPKPDYAALAGHSSSRRKSTSSTLAPKPKRTVVYSDDDEDEQEYVEEPTYSRGRKDEEEEEDDLMDFGPEPPKRSASKKGKSAAGTKGGKGKAAKSDEKEMLVRDDRKYVPGTRSPSPSSQGMSTKRAHTEEVDVEEEQPVVDSSTAKVEADKEKEPLPGFKKRKLPTIKKNKPPGASNSLTGPSTPAVRPSPQKPNEPERLPLPVLKKPASVAPNADFDLRDASVYASLFQKPGGTTPNSGLNRKEKEEERRKELNRMRDDARAKRLQEAKNTFNLQASHDKISRFEEKLHARKSMAVYPNILGATFKEIYDRKKRQAFNEAQKGRR
ncbi:hypothetical protein EUX98_g3049 [Antrodiella citrinella]|uniref:Uncharacterized protein n=1 Tax=Antrodiella citrinella TaxID=2447956 RepID=A0A4S4N087_9APHY|nr:hypothetical protein EUX98_g3049 [Antrodiella citrinella]